MNIDSYTFVNINIFNIKYIHICCARVVAGRYYKGQRLSSTLNRFRDPLLVCRSGPVECGAKTLPSIVPPW